MNETIDKYLNNELTAEEKSAFENELFSNAELRNEIESYKLIISAYEREALKQDLQIVERQIHSKKQRLRWTQLTTYTLAAVACITFVILHFNTIQTMQLQAQYHFSQTEEFLFRGGSDVDMMILNAHEQIANAEYRTAIENLSSALELLFAEQNRTLSLSKCDTTTPEGEDFAQMTTLKIYETQWLKALAYMKNGNVWKAKRLLREISNSDSCYAVRARKILKR